VRVRFKKSFFIFIVAATSGALAGSYEDFFSAIRQDDARTVQSLLVRGFDANTRDPSGLHGLYLAVREPSPKVAAVLLAWSKTEIEARTLQDESPLMIAALNGQLDLAVRLIERGADVNKPGWTPLHYASTRGHLAMMRLLLEHHAYIDAESPNGTTPLMMAAHYGTTDAVKLLLQDGADPMPRNQQNMTAIDFAQRAGRNDVVELIAAAIRAKQPKGVW
jgi:ankyrin repeat protein